MEPSPASNASIITLLILRTGTKGYWFLGAFKILAQQVVKSMRGAVPVQDLPGPIVEHHVHPLDLRTRQLSKPRAFGKELAQQPVGVLVRASFPGGMGWAK
jgi:hypothetical protein